MKKSVSKLKLNRETLHLLSWVSGSIVNPTDDPCDTPTGPTFCEPVPSVDGCGSSPIGTCASSNCASRSPCH